MLASVLVSSVPLAPVATKPLLKKETLYKSLIVLDAAAGVHVLRSVLVKMLPPLPTATYLMAPETSPTPRLFIPYTIVRLPPSDPRSVMV